MAAIKGGKRTRQKLWAILLIGSLWMAVAWGAQSVSASQPAASQPATAVVAQNTTTQTMVDTSHDWQLALREGILAYHSRSVC
ncbi:MAG: hypothetical protein HC800_18990 [Phormidesmis sp. RL_2_1]|nr:hypothetical protein [Phormidesmis sp. RL_2_1]